MSLWLQWNLGTVLDSVEEADGTRSTVILRDGFEGGDEEGSGAHRMAGGMVRL